MTRRRSTLPLAVWTAIGATATVLAVVGLMAGVLARGGLDRTELLALGLGLLVGLSLAAVGVLWSRRLTAGLRELHADAVRRLRDPSLRVGTAAPELVGSATEFAELARVLDALHLRARVADEVAEQSRRTAEQASAGVFELLSGLVAAEEATRGQLSAELHDTVAQSLAAARSLLAEDAAADPAGTSQNGAHQNGTSPDGTSPDGTSPDGTSPDGTSPDGAHPDGAHPDGAHPDGAHPDGLDPDGLDPDGLDPDGTSAMGTSQNGTSADGVGRSRLERVRELVEDAEEQVRAVMARARPAELRDGDLASAVGALRREFASRYLVTVRLTWPQQAYPLPLVSAVTVYRFFQEALLNVVKHADVDEADASLGIEGDQLVARVRDAGPGFVPGQVPSGGGRHVGLGLLRERARLAGGALDLTTAPGEGTLLTLRLPLSPRTGLGLGSTNGTANGTAPAAIGV